MQHNDNSQWRDAFFACIQRKAENSLAWAQKRRWTSARAPPNDSPRAFSRWLAGRWQQANEVEQCHRGDEHLNGQFSGRPAKETSALSLPALDGDSVAK